MSRTQIFQQLSSVPADRLDKLPPWERAVLHSNLNNTPHTEIAKVLRISVSRSRRCLKDALQRLRIPELPTEELLDLLNEAGYPYPAQATLVLSGFLDAVSRGHHIEKAREVRTVGIDVLDFLRKSPKPEFENLMLALETALQMVSTPNGVSTPICAPDGEQIKKLVQTHTESPVETTETNPVVEFLREYGPQPRDLVAQQLDAAGHKGSTLIRSAARLKLVYVVNLFGLKEPQYRHVLLLPQAAKKVSESFKADWHAAVKEFCQHYKTFTTTDVFYHLGVAPRAISVVEDNLSIVEELIQKQGFHKSKGRWVRQRAASKETLTDINDQLLRTISEKGAVKMGELLKTLNVPRQTLAHHLKILVDEGKVAKFGQTAGTVYFIPES